MNLIDKGSDVVRPGKYVRYGNVVEVGTGSNLGRYRVLWERYDRKGPDKRTWVKADVIRLLTAQEAVDRAFPAPSEDAFSQMRDEIEREIEGVSKMDGLIAIAKDHAARRADFFANLPE